MPPMNAYRFGACPAEILLGHADHVRDGDTIVVNRTAIWLTGCCCALTGVTMGPSVEGRDAASPCR